MWEGQAIKRLHPVMRLSLLLHFITCAQKHIDHKYHKISGEGSLASTALSLDPTLLAVVVVYLL